jgi:hypothetical protein
MSDKEKLVVAMMALKMTFEVSKSGYNVVTFHSMKRCVEVALKNLEE